MKTDWIFWYWAWLTDSINNPLLLLDHRSKSGDRNAIVSSGILLEICLFILQTGRCTIMEDKAAIENSMQSHKMIVSIWPIGLNDLLMLRNDYSLFATSLSKRERCQCETPAYFQCRRIAENRNRNSFRHSRQLAIFNGYNGQND